MLTCGCCAAGLPIGMNKFWRLPTVTGDWFAFIGDDTWFVGEENDGVAERELLRETISRRKIHRINERSIKNVMNCARFGQTYPTYLPHPFLLDRSGQLLDNWVKFLILLTYLHRLVCYCWIGCKIFSALNRFVILFCFYLFVDNIPRLGNESVYIPGKWWASRWP